jgi:type VI secretion system protein VasJ
MVAKCLEGLKAHDALRLLRLTLQLFIGEFPELTEYKYVDGTPFASPKTIHGMASLDCLDTGTLGSLSNALTMGNNRQDGGQDSESEENLLREALELWRDGDFQAGLKRMGPLVPSKTRASIRHGLLTARYCLAAGQPAAAANLLGDLYDNLDSWGLLEWEPELSSEILTLIAYAYTYQKMEVPEMVRQKLYWFNMETAINSF